MAMRTFDLHRAEDETGISGTGVVAEGVVFTDGSCALTWLTEHTSVAFYASIDEVEAIHGHCGKTKIVYTGAPFGRGWADCQQDRCENTPFGCVGGLDVRPDLRVPEYITPHERKEYIEGYKMAARALYGEDWDTCRFGWKPAIVIGSG